MDAAAVVSVEELDLCIRDKPVSYDTLSPRYRQVVQNQTSTLIQPDFENTTISAKESSRQQAPKQTPFENNPSKRHSTLPSICVKKNGKSSSELFMVKSDKYYEEPALLGALKSLNTNSLENVITTNDGHLQPVGLKPEQRLGKKLLAPLIDPKQHSSSQKSARERTNSNPDLSSQKLRHKAPKENSKNQGLMNDTEQDFDVQKPRAQTHEGLLGRPKENLTSSSVSNSEERTFLSIPHAPHRRFSAPLSPRFVRRLIPEKLYSSTEINTSENELHEREYRPRTPDRGNIFSPPAKEFDEIEGQKTEGRDISQSDFPQTNLVATNSLRRSLDFDFRSNPTRFLSDIRVTFTDKTFIAQPKGRTKGDKRKNSYTLSASSEALLSDEILPPVRTAMPECGQSGRNRAYSTSGLPITPRNDQSKRTFDSPIFLDPGTQRLSHLSLSPRLPRKF